jgi:hypothetical protein
MYDLESIASGVGILVRNNLVTQDVDVTLDFCFLDELKLNNPDQHESGNTYRPVVAS